MQAESMGPQIGQDTVFQACGKMWKTGRLTKEVWDALVAWAQPRIINPLEYLKPIIGLLDPMTARLLISEAIAKCPAVLTITHPLIQEAVNNTPEGGLELFHLLLKQNHPDITYEQSIEICKQIGEAKQQELILKAAGKLPPEQKKNPGTNGSEHAVDLRLAEADQLAAHRELSLAGMPSPTVGNPKTYAG